MCIREAPPPHPSCDLKFPGRPDPLHLNPIRQSPFTADAFVGPAIIIRPFHSDTVYQAMS